MQFIVLIYQNEDVLKGFTKSDWAGIHGEYLAINKELEAAGQYHKGYGMQPVAVSKTVRSRDGKILINDGPFIEMKDTLTAIKVIEAPDMARALEIAGKFPAVRWGSAEVRPVVEYKSTYVETYKS